jgi:hypothetical protein
MRNVLEKDLPHPIDPLRLDNIVAFPYDHYGTITGEEVGRAGKRSSQRLGSSGRGKS